MYGALIFSVFIEISSYPEEFFERNEEITFNFFSSYFAKIYISNWIYCELITRLLYKTNIQMKSHEIRSKNYMHLRQTATYLKFSLFSTRNSVISLCLNILSLLPLFNRTRRSTSSSLRIWLLFLSIQ
jgi:hypothetical protein